MPIEHIEIDEFKQRMASNEELTILDIRTPYEVEEFSIGGIAIPLEELFSRISEIEYLKTQEIIIVCGNGFQSFAAQKILQKKGFTHTRNLVGGLEELILSE
jgi:rhodanese-related sulfurtransferase